jgi:hypothetical protein
VFTAVMRSRWRVASLAVVLTGALAGSASAAVTLTIDSTARLSPGRFHATLTGTVTCDAGSTLPLTGQIVQPNTTFGLGATSVVCDGTSRPYRIDVNASIGSGVFEPGRASAQVSAFSCSLTSCGTTYIDALIDLEA